MPVPLIVFTDLDGTLLDHETYDHAPARPMLDRLRRARVPLVLASSKTASEVAPLRMRLGFADCPAIVENGAGLLPAGQTRPSGARSHDRLRAVLAALPDALRRHFSGFSDWSVADLARRTGLPPQDAARARQRDFSEPGLFTGTAAQRAQFVAALARAGVTAQPGGRYLTLSFGASKADRMAEVVAALGGAGVTVALGDAPNDLAMLAAADHAIVVPNPSHPGLALQMQGAADRMRRAPCPGPAGWAAALQALLSEIHALPE